MLHHCRRQRPQIERLEGRRLLAAGILDSSFGSGGKATVSVPGIRFVSLKAAPTPDGKTIVGGIYNSVSGNVITAQGGYVMRLTAAGTLDTTFGSGGKITLPTGNRF